MKPPPNTCPQIDRLSVTFDAISGDLETFRDDLLEYREPRPDEVREIVAQTIEGLQQARRLLEDLRAANEALRECGRYWYQRANTPPPTEM